MNTYPLKEINRDQWQKKVNCTAMYTIPAQDEAFPILQELNQILNRLITLPIQQTLDQSVIEYFFTYVFPSSCVKIIRSKYFKNQEVLKYSNLVLQKSVYLVPLYLNFAIKFPKFLEIMQHIFSEQYYFKNNNQMHYMTYPYSYFPGKKKQLALSQGSLIDILKFSQIHEKLTWSQGKILSISPSPQAPHSHNPLFSLSHSSASFEPQIEIEYLFDKKCKTITVKKSSQIIQQHGKQSKVFQWRMALKEGDLVDVQDSFGMWYNGTVLEIIQRDSLQEEEIIHDFQEDEDDEEEGGQKAKEKKMEEEKMEGQEKNKEKGEEKPLKKKGGKKDVRVTLKVYNEQGNKQDENGKYFGFAEFEQVLDYTSPQLAPYCSIAKQFCYESSKTTYDAIQDINDYEFQEINGEKIYALPRRKHLSQFQFQTINQFGRLGGFQKYIDYLQKQNNFDLFCYYVKGISGTSAYLNRQLVKTLTQKLKTLLNKYLFSNSEKPLKSFTKQQSEMAFSGLRPLMKRIYTGDMVSKFENNIKMLLAQTCLQSQAIKNKLLGLNQLKDIVRSVTYVSEKNKYIKQWVKNNKIFEKVYIVNSHVQLIKKSEEFFKYLINQNILQVTDLQKLYKLAQKGDFQSRVSLYKLFQQVSHIFKKQHVQFLIDTILESQLNLILNEDIDLLHQLSRFSNYFPLEKVVKFFENIILGENKVKQLNDYAIKKYSEIVSKNVDMKPYRKSITKSFVEKLATHDLSQVTKVLKGIFQGIAIGDWGKKDLNQILTQQKIDQVILSTLKTLKPNPQFPKNTSILLDFLLFIYKSTSKIKIDIKILVQIWQIIKDNEQKQKQFYKWANQVSKTDQGFQGSNIEEVEEFYRRLFSPELIPDIQGSHFQLARNLFVEINKKIGYISVVNTYKQREMEKQYKRKVQMKNLRLIDVIIQMVYKIKSEAINDQVLHFFIQLYTSKDNSQKQIDEFLNELLTDFKNQHESKNYKMLIQTIKLIQVVINDSEKTIQTKINSLISKKQSDTAKFIIINELSSISIDSKKKTQLPLPMNTTLIRLRKTLSTLFSTPWAQIKIVSTNELPDYLNSLTLKQLHLSPSQPLTISRLSTPSIPQQQLIIPLPPSSSSSSLSPKAIRCFSTIFSHYSTNGKMDKNQCNEFTTICLGVNCSAKYYHEKISSLYAKYDDDQDGFLTLDNFLLFYEDAAKDRPSTVWANLKSFGVRGDFRFKDQQDQEIKIENFPRNTIAEYGNMYEILFELLHVDSVASVAFQLLERLPVSKGIEKELLGIGCRQDLQKILSTHDLYELSYKLNIIEYLAHSSDLQTQQEKKWHEKFIQLQGYQLLLNCLESIVKDENKNEESNQQIKKQLLETSLNLLNEYWLQCFSSDIKNTRLSLSFISNDQQIDNKMDYLVFGKFFNSEKKIQPKKSKLPDSIIKCTWKGKPKDEIIQFLSSQFQKKWLQSNTAPTLTPNPGDALKPQNPKKLNSQSLLLKLMDSLNILCLNENPKQIVSVLPNLLDKIPSKQLIKRLYCLILSQCFYTNETKYQGLFIRELFKNLTKANITSEHYRVLAVLVSKFGISGTDQGQQSEQDTTKLKQVLFQNVLNNQNELTVQGCAKLLINFNLQKTPYETMQQIWQKRIFNPSLKDQKQQSRKALFNLILQIIDYNPSLLNKFLHRVVTTLQKQLKNIKIVYCNEFKQRSATGYAGLKNLGSTCYINSMLQQLYMNRNFRYCLLRADDCEKENYVEVVDNKNQGRMVDDNFLHQVQRIFANLELTSRIDFAPRDFCVAYKPFGESVNVLIQQDVQEFVSMFFDRLEAGLSKTIFKRLVSDFYIGKTTNLFKCHSCNQTKKVQQTFHCLSLEVKSSKTLQQSFTRFLHGQMISDYKCQFCNNKVDVTKMTRISSCPKILIIHLQRIVFNLDTFINQKITTKHSFPPSFNLYPSTLTHYQTPPQSSSSLSTLPSQYNYTLIGIICHTGTAQSGHYISYIKIGENKWIQINDSIVMQFNQNNIENQCFGGYFSSSAFQDQYFQEKKESSKSAYVLLYEKDGGNQMEIVLERQLAGCKNQKEREKVKEAILKQLDLEEVKERIKNIQKINTSESKNVMKSQSQSNENTQNVMQSHEESSSAPQDSQKQVSKLLQQKQLEIKRHQSQDNIQTNLPTSQPQSQPPVATQPSSAPQQTIVHIKAPVSPYVPQNLQKQILLDNEIHFFQKSLSSPSFVKFFSQLISKIKSSSSMDYYSPLSMCSVSETPSIPCTPPQYSQLLPICKKLTFGFWLKSPNFKQLLSMLQSILKSYPQGFESTITDNPLIITLLIESTDIDIRTSMAAFLARIIADVLAVRGTNVRDNGNDGIFLFLDKLLGLLPTTVSKCWTRFSQYFQFWYQLSTKGEVLIQYMIDREIIKHFMDYFLDTKSPLKIYATKRQHQIGSSYANPNFTMLLKCVFSLLQQRMILNQKRNDKSAHMTSNPDEQKLLMSFQGLQKLISENYQNIASQLVKQICPNNLAASQKAAIVILKGISKSNSESVQPYLELLHEFVLIDDKYQDLRMKWVIGKQTLVVSNQTLKISALNAYSLDEKLFSYDSTIYLENGSSLIQPILTYHRRIEAFAILCTKQALKLCDASQKIRKYITSFSAPTLLYARFMDFIKSFVDKYYQDNKKSYGFYSSSVGFNREQFGKQVKQLLQKVLKKIQQDQKEISQPSKVQQKRVPSQQPSLTQPNSQSKQNSLPIKSAQTSKPQQTPQSCNPQPDNSSQNKNTYKIISSEPDTETGPEPQPENQKQEQKYLNKNYKQQIDSSNEAHDENYQKKQLEDFDEAENYQDGKNYGIVYDDQSQQKQRHNKGEDKEKQKENQRVDHGIAGEIIQMQEISSGTAQNKDKNIRVGQYGFQQDNDWMYDQIYTVEPAKLEKQKRKTGRKTGNDSSSPDAKKNSSNQYTITISEQKNEKFMNYSDSQDEQPLMKTKIPPKAQPQQQAPIDYIPGWHPIKLQSIPSSSSAPISLPQLPPLLKIQALTLSLTSLLTKPTGYTNRSFYNSGGIHKNVERILQETWKNQKNQVVKCFWVKNNGRDGVRIQTDQGCLYCKGNENLVIWANQVRKVWEAEKSFDWPKWRMYE